MLGMFPDAIVDDPIMGLNPEETCDVAMVCVPTPLKDGKLDTSIVESVVRRAKESLIIVRSTMNPGTTDNLVKETGKRIIFQPEYIGETLFHPMSDQKQRQFIILGGREEDVEKVIELYQRAYNANVHIRQTTALEAEIIKLSENRAIGFKVAQCQELYDACKAAGVNYYTVRDAVYSDDPRFNLWFTFIYPEKRGFLSSCLPKDIYAWAAWAESTGINPELTKSMLMVNDRYIRGREIER
jgi:UDPglucose 6-dehydrogenase